jgi:hypothetical protein
VKNIALFFLAVTTIAKFSNLASLTVSQRRNLFDVVDEVIHSNGIRSARQRRQVLAGGIDTAALDAEMKSFFESQGASNVTLTWNR